MLSSPRIPLLLLSTWVAFFSGACCGGQFPPPDNLVEDPDVIVGYMVGRLGDLQSARFQVVSEYYGGDMRGANFRNGIAVEQPNRLLIQVLSPLGGDVISQMTSDGETLALYDLHEQIFYTGRPTPRNIARILPFYMTAEDIVRVLLGGPPLDLFSIETQEYQLSWDEDRGFYKLEVPLASQDGTLALWIRDGDWGLAWAERHDLSGELVFELRTGDFVDFDGFMMPSRLRFLLEGEHSVDMSLEVESGEVNIDIPDRVFTQTPPNGVPVRNLD